MSYGPFRTALRGLVAGLALSLACTPAWAKCEMASVANLPVTMADMKALLPAKINGQDVQFVIDSGATFSHITAANADKFKLPREPLPRGVSLKGVNGEIDAEVGFVKVLTIANTPIPDIGFVVGGGGAKDAVGLLGQNILGRWDVEYDLARGKVQLWVTKGCSEGSDMAYWARAAPASFIYLDTEIEHVHSGGHTMGPVYVNGVRLTAIFDTGASSSIMTREAAYRAGISSNDPGVVSSGNGVGLGRGVVRTWVGPVKSFKIGDEEIRDTKIRFGDIDLGEKADMLVGADFFLAHHIFVSNQQHKLYLTYNGGPVFNLDQTPSAVAGVAPAPSKAEPSEIEPTDATGFARRGAAFAARNELAPAIADLSKAIEMAPAVADYRYRRGLAYRRNAQPFLAMADFDATLKLKPDDAPALIARAGLRFAGHETAQAVQDLEAADKASAKEDDSRLQIAMLYAGADLPAAAIDQYNLWIAAHSEDAHLADALNGRCWTRALAGVDLDKALTDCDRAIHIAPKTAALLDSRGLVYLRLGDFDKAIADYNAALAIDPKLGWSLYGRGLAEQRKGLTTQGAADISAATAINPKLPDEVKKRGLTS